MRYPKHIQEQLKKMEVKDVLKCFGEDLFDGIDLRVFTEAAYKIANDTGYKYKTIFLEKEDYGYDGAYDLYLKGIRLESDKEFAYRQDKVLTAYKTKLEKRKTDVYKKEQKELKEYRRLRKKFGNAQ